MRFLLLFFFFFGGAKGDFEESCINAIRYADSLQEDCEIYTQIR